MKFLDKPLFTFEMANNHMGDVEHGLRIVREFGLLRNEFPEFNFSMKLQYRDNSFFHPKHIDRKDHRLIKRFTETRLSDSDFKRIVDEIRTCGFISMCTPWDESAVEYLEKMGIEVLKIASCSFTDWSLLEKAVKTEFPIIASTAGATEDEILNVNEFLKNRKKAFAFMHCVGEYPCSNDRLELNQIDYLKSLLDVPIGFSTHESPDNMDSIKVAIAKGARIFEKHVGVANEKYALNAYSANPHQARQWLDSARTAYRMCGGSTTIRKQFSGKEIEDLRILHRGAYARTKLAPGQLIDADSIFLAMPNVEGQVVAKDLGKYRKHHIVREIQPGDPILLADVEVVDTRRLVLEYREQLRAITRHSQILLPESTYIEISHHYGLERFPEVGAGLIHLINREYSKIIVVMLPGQRYPEHKHVQKDETYYVIFGDLCVTADGKTTVLKPGETLSVARGTLHSFRTETGVVFEEIATRYIPGDSQYADEKIPQSSSRKTIVPL